MAFASVRSSTSNFNAAVTTHNINLPATIESGDLILIIGASDNVTAITKPTEVTNEFMNSNVSGQFRNLVWGFVADGTEDSTTITADTGVTAEYSSFISLAIQGWEGTIGTAVEVSTGSAATSTTPDPDSLTPTWGAKDTMWIAVGAGDRGNIVFSVYPTNYTGNNIEIDPGAGSGRQTVAIGTRELNATSDDPGTFTMDASWPNSGITIAIEPAAGGGSTPKNRALKGPFNGPFNGPF